MFALLLVLLVAVGQGAGAEHVKHAGGQNVTATTQVASEVNVTEAAEVAFGKGSNASVVDLPVTAVSKTMAERFHCLDRRIAHEFVCDGVPDCDDGSDEKDCAGRCSPRAVQCRGDGKCISYDYYCEGFEVCANGSDEKGCEPKQFKPYNCKFTVRNRTEEEDKRTCNGIVDCPDGKDEKDCWNCWKHAECIGGKCMTPGSFCDGHNDTSNGEDEWDCVWPGGPLNRREMIARLVVGSRVVRAKDWVWGNMDGDPPGKGTVISSIDLYGRLGVQWDNGNRGTFRMGYVCGQKYDLQLLAEEPPLRQFAVRSPCPTGMHSCGNRCIAQDFVRDGSVDCQDNSDEEPKGHGTDEEEGNCSPRALKCKGYAKTGGRCFPLSRACDGRSHCFDGSDESNCQDAPLRGQRYTCKNNDTLVALQICDGVPDCGTEGSEDEGGCTACQGGAFYCHGRCLLPAHVCDGYRDCSGGEDERDCGSGPGEQLSGRQMAARLVVGSRVVRGKDWKWGKVDGNSEGTVTDIIDLSGWLGVRWDSGKRGRYRMGNDSSFDLRLLAGEKPQYKYTYGTKQSFCPPGSIICPNGKRCLLPEFICDGYSDCFKTNDDEENCDKCNGEAVLCTGSRGERWCARPPETRRCNGRKDCNLGFNEEACPNATTKRAHFTCARNDTDPTGHYCDDGHDDGPMPPNAKCKNKHASWTFCSNIYVGTTDQCYYQEDEEECTACQDGAVFCDNRCVPAARICDGYRDCVDGEDEQDCYPDGPNSLGNLQTAARLTVGTRVVRGKHWDWGETQGRGHISGILSFDGWVEVTWDNGRVGDYRMGHSGKYDLQLLNEEQLYTGDAGCGQSSGSWTPLVVNGHAASLGAVPWHAALYITDGNSTIYQCGATLISRSYVVTAAHCVIKSGRVASADQFHIALGKVFSSWDDSSEESQKFEVDRIIVPENYEGSVLFYQSDIALLKLKKIVPFGKYVAPICLQRNIHVVENEIIQVLGWGNGSVALKELASVGLQYVNQAACFQYLKENVPKTALRYVANDKFCGLPRITDGAKLTNLAQGDSGGGAVVQSGDAWFLVGIVSIGLGGHNEAFGFTNVTMYYDWLMKTLET